MTATLEQPQLDRLSTRIRSPWEEAHTLPIQLPPNFLQRDCGSPHGSRWAETPSPAASPVREEGLDPASPGLPCSFSRQVKRSVCGKERTARPRSPNTNELLLDLRSEPGTGYSSQDETLEPEHSSSSCTTQCRRLSLDDNNIGIVGPDGQLMRCANLPEAWRPWELSVADIEYRRGSDGRAVLLGSGQFGQVFLADLYGINPVAVKRLLMDHTTAVREAAMLKSLCSPNIVLFQGACIDGDVLLLVTEFMAGGDLNRAIHTKHLVTWHRRGASIALDIVKGLHYLHSRGVVHLDIKPSNILLTRHGVAKLADIGLARVTCAPDTASFAEVPNTEDSAGILGTFQYASPEQMMTGQQYTSKSDMFAFGVVLWEIVTGERPQRGQMREVRVPEECPQEVADLIDQCTEQNPEDRPSAKEVHDTLRAMENSAAPGNKSWSRSSSVRFSCAPYGASGSRRASYESNGGVGAAAAG